MPRLSAYIFVGNSSSCASQKNYVESHPVISKRNKLDIRTTLCSATCYLFCGSIFSATNQTIESLGTPPHIKSTRETYAMKLGFIMLAHPQIKICIVLFATLKMCSPWHRGATSVATCLKVPPLCRQYYLDQKASDQTSRSAKSTQHRKLIRHIIDNTPLLCPAQVRNESVIQNFRSI